MRPSGRLSTKHLSNNHVTRRVGVSIGPRYICWTRQVLSPSSSWRSSLMFVSLHLTLFTRSKKIFGHNLLKFDKYIKIIVYELVREEFKGLIIFQYMNDDICTWHFVKIKGIDKNGRKLIGATKEHLTNSLWDLTRGRIIELVEMERFDLWLYLIFSYSWFYLYILIVF